MHSFGLNLCQMCSFLKWNVTEINYTGTAEDEMNINWNIASLRDIYIRRKRELRIVIRWNMIYIIHAYLFIVLPATPKKLNGIYWFHLVCPSLRMWTETSARSIFHNTSWIDFIFTHLINPLQKVCRLLSSFRNSKIVFFVFFLIWNFHFVLCPCYRYFDSLSGFLLQPL